jgi:hypothetical protein
MLSLHKLRCQGLVFPPPQFSCDSTRMYHTWNCPLHIYAFTDGHSSRHCSVCVCIFPTGLHRLLVLVSPSIVDHSASQQACLTCLSTVPSWTSLVRFEDHLLDLHLIEEVVVFYTLTHWLDVVRHEATRLSECLSSSMRKDLLKFILMLSQALKRFLEKTWAC